ncbi:MFS transporter [Nonomuraea sp. MCN248]|uniref:MFS-type drug efflux transporter P55 n=1 Tax=Nonomuraea corallina TaxID=2989783 RepID=A0ABT4SIY7_9ACTN|nr:MFS transporter [Nonomuraea corallina]MDA0636978.1 MFS transporter [Nonomuraea corallina]
MRRARRVALGVGGAVVLLAALDAYVVVTVLIDIATDLGIPLNRLERATPVVTGFLLGYVAAMPLLGQLSDRYGRRPLIHACLAAFALGSVLTALAASEVMVVTGRAVQGVAGGALLPITMALIGDLWGERERPVALGAVGAAQELGSALGPVYGGVLALIPGFAVLGVELGGWHAIFWINVPLALAAALAVQWAIPARPPAALQPSAGAPGTPDDAPHAAGTPGVPGDPARHAGAAAGAQGSLDARADGPERGTVTEAPALPGDAPSPSHTSPSHASPSHASPGHASLGHATSLSRAASGGAVRVDWAGGGLLALALGLLVVGLYNPDPATTVLPAWGPPLIGAGVLVAAVFVWWEVRSPVRLLDLTGVPKRPLLATLGVSFVTGAALLVTMVFVQFTAQTLLGLEALEAALVLGRFLIALPVGALLGGLLTRRSGGRAVTVAGLLVAAAGYAMMSRWPLELAEARLMMDATLVVAGLGVGLVIAPVSAAALRVTPPAQHGVASAAVVVARMMGMLIGIAAVSAWGFHRFQSLTAHLDTPVPFGVEPAEYARLLAEYTAKVQAALHVEYTEMFLVTAAICLIGAALGWFLPRGAGAHPPPA